MVKRSKGVIKTKICPVCGKKFKRKDFWYMVRAYCSRECNIKARSKIYLTK